MWSLGHLTPAHSREQVSPESKSPRSRQPPTAHLAPDYWLQAGLGAWGPWDSH